MKSRRASTPARSWWSLLVAGVLTAAAALPFGAVPAHAQEQVSRAYPPTLEGSSEVSVYKTVGGTELKLYVFQPEGNGPGKLTPAIVFFFGGGWRSGSPEQWYRQLKYFSSRGMVAIAVDYRVRSRHNTTPLDAVRDAKSSLRWVRANAQRLGIDPDRIVAAGGSAGGHLAAAAGVIDGLDEPDEDLSVSSKPNALVLYNPVLILAPVQGLPFGGSGLGGGSVEGRRAISPYHHVDRGDPPTIIFHGKRDGTVDYGSAVAFTVRMLEAGNRAEVVLYDEAGHGFFNASEYYPDVTARTDRFLASLGYLQGEPTIR